jgi:hypothetical protein
MNKQYFASDGWHKGKLPHMATKRKLVDWNLVFRVLGGACIGLVMLWVIYSMFILVFAK